MNHHISEMIRFVEENDVKFIRLAFCDIFGTQKNISILPQELPRAFSNGISFDASAIEGFMNVEQSDLFLVPDFTTLCVLPWRPSQGRVIRFFCDIKNPNGTPFIGDGRAILKQAVEKIQHLGYTCKVGMECEFYLFQRDDKGEPIDTPLDHAGYFDIAPLDKGENVRREICLTLQSMGIEPETSHHEQGPGQNEIDFKYSDPLTSADHFITFKSVVKTIAAQNGLFASFMPKPLAENSGNGLHVNLSLYQNERNIIETEVNTHSPIAESFIAGLLNRIQEMTVFLNPITNSYHRFGSYEAPRFGSYEAPRYVSWSHQNRSQLIRIPAAMGENRRIELRSPDASCNPYFALALILLAGMEGIEKQLPLSKPVNCNLFDDQIAASSLETLPKNLETALYLAKNSSFIKNALPPQTLERYYLAKEKEILEIEKSSFPRDTEKDLYFYFL